MTATAVITTRRGMTLVELLVVVAILGLLSATVLPNLSGVTAARNYREAARSASTFIARCQSRAIGANEPRGVMLQPLSSNTATSIDLSFADTPETYSGETATSAATVQQVSGSLSSGTLGVTFDSLTQARLGVPGFCTAGDTIQFGGVGPKYKFIPPSTVTMWFEDNQNTRNTSWPRATGLPFRIWRQPTRGTGGSLQLQRGASIDLGWCCLGTRPFSTFMTTLSQDNTITILFDSAGKPSEIVHSGGVRTSVGSPIFLLIGQAELAGNAYDSSIAGSTALPEPEDRTGANWQYADCIWLCIDNNSGVVKSGNVAGGATSVLASQRFVRLTPGYGGSER